MSVHIRPLREFDVDDFRRLSIGYTSPEKYVVSKAESDDAISLSLTRTVLPEPYRKQFDDIDDESAARYAQVVRHGCSFGAYVGAKCVGIVIAEPHTWNRSLWVWELHVDPKSRGQGIGRRLLDALLAAGKSRNLRTCVCETQNTNVPAMDFYRSVGFSVDAIDLSYYSNDDAVSGEVAVFMKKPIA